MRKGGVDVEKTNNIKTITVHIEGEKDQADMKITREDEKDPKVENGAEGQNELDLSHLKLSKLPDDTVIFTHKNPTCGYYYFNGRLWYR